MGADKKNVADLTAEELYALAREREQEEAERREKESRKKRDELKAKRKEMVARHRKELAELDRMIVELGGSMPKARASRSRRRGAGAAGTISQQLCEIVATQPEMSVGEIREQAESAGIDTKNISQTLAYLKRQGRLASPRRGVYAAP